jgi:pimeloyl-ACP methyl ester carboxylesterase
MSSVLFIHGLWIHSSSWDPWIARFEASGHHAVAPGWPGDGDTVAATRSHPERLAGIGISAIVNHYRGLIRALPEQPIVIGHSFGGLIAQKLLAEGDARAAVAIDPAPIKGVTKLPFAQLRSALPVLSRKANAERAVSLTPGRFRYGFGNAIPRAESDALFDRYTIPGPGRPLFEAAGAKKDPASPAAVPLDDSARGPLLVLGGALDHTVPEVVSRLAAGLYRPGTSTTYERVEGRGHSLVFDHGWQSVADRVLAWVDEQAAVPRG